MQCKIDSRHKIVENLESGAALNAVSQPQTHPTSERWRENVRTLQLIIKSNINLETALNVNPTLFPSENLLPFWLVHASQRNK